MSDFCLHHNHPFIDSTEPWYNSAYDYEDVITVENAQGKLNADPTGDFVLRGPSVALNGVNTEYLNAQEVNTDGIDVAADWSIFSLISVK